jgi:3-hydroxyisobutyrate dehydrogenase
MAKIGFIGLGRMGLPMAQNLVKVGHAVAGFDLSEHATERLAAGGGTRANSVADASQGAEIIITMLPAGDEVREVYFSDDGVLVAAPAGALVIDSTTIDVKTARDVAQAAEAKGLAMVDAPVSGGVAGAQTATLTFMVGGPEAAFERARPVLEAMGKTIVHAGGAGNGQAAGICNNMILGASMLVVSEASCSLRSLALTRRSCSTSPRSRPASAGR